MSAAAATSKPNECALPDDLRGVSLIGKNLQNVDLSGRDLSGADLSEANLSAANLSGANLTNAVLYRANLSECELLRATLDNTDLSEANASRAGFGHASLINANLFGATLDNATFTNANLTNADLRNASAQRSRFCSANLTNALLSTSNLQDSDLSGSTVADATFNETILQGARVKLVTGYHHASWIGADILNVDFCGNYSMRRFIMDQNFLEEFRTRSKGHTVLHWLWWVTSDCGRSFVRWGMWTFLIAAIFAGLYGFVAIDYGDHYTPLSPLYYSIVTLTTLGYGDVLPTSMGGQIMVMVQVVIGYVMLGGMLSIFSNKMSRRAD